MEKERYELVNEDILRDNQENMGYVITNKTMVEWLNQQNKRIKELEKENQKANIKNYLTDYYLVEKENQHLKEEIKLLDEDRQFKAEMWTKFADKCKSLTQQLKQSQNQKAIEVLEKIKRYFDDKGENDESDGWIITNRIVVEYINKQIEELEGDKK